MTQIAFPFRPGGRGRTADAGDDDHVRQLIEQVLFTSPGERVMRPTFGCGLLQLVFTPLGDALASATRIGVQGALQQWLGDRVHVQDVAVEVEDATVTVTVTYLTASSDRAEVAQFTRRP